MELASESVLVAALVEPLPVLLEVKVEQLGLESVGFGPVEVVDFSRCSANQARPLIALVYPDRRGCQQKLFLP